LEKFSNFFLGDVSVREHCRSLSHISIRHCAFSPTLSSPCSGCLESCYRPFPNQVVFKLSQGTEDMEYQAATGTGGVDGFRQRFESDFEVEPVMGDFARSTVGNKTYWELPVCGKGEKDRWIPLPEEYLGMKRYRKYRNLAPLPSPLSPLPSPGETSPMVTRVNSDTPITHKRQIERIVEQSIMMAVERMEKDNFANAAEETSIA